MSNERENAKMYETGTTLKQLNEKCSYGHSSTKKKKERREGSEEER